MAGNVLNREPILWLTLIQALIALAVGFGLKVTTEQMGLIMTATAALLGFIAREAVTPNAKISGRTVVGIMLLFVLFGALFPRAAEAATPPLALERLSGGLTAQAAAYTGSIEAEDTGPIVTF